MYHPESQAVGKADLGQKSVADLTEGMINRPGIKQQFIPDQVESGLVEEPPVSPADLVSGLSKKEVKPQVDIYADCRVFRQPKSARRSDGVFGRHADSAHC